MVAIFLLFFLSLTHDGAVSCFYCRVSFRASYVAEGIQGVANVLTGAVSPSGRLVDTWAACSYSSPAMQNLELNQWTNYTDVLAQSGSSMESAQDYSYLWTDAFLIYQEGIYVGYKYSVAECDFHETLDCT